MTHSLIIRRSRRSKFAQRLLDTPFLRFLKDVNIGRKVVTGFGILVVLSFISAGVSYLGSAQATEKIDRTGDLRVPTALTASRAQADLLRVMSDVRGYLALGDQKYRDSFNESTKAFENDLAELESQSSYLDNVNQGRLRALQAAYAEWSKYPDRLFELRDDQLEREPAYRLLATDGTKYAGNVLSAINTMIELQGQREPNTENQTRLQDMAKFQGNFAAMLSALRGYVTTRNRIFRGEYEVNLADNQNAWSRLSSKRSTLTATQQTLIDQIGQNRDAFLKLPNQMFKDLEGARWREDLYIFSEQAVPQAENMQKLLSNLVDDQQNLLTDDLDVGRQDLNRTNQLILTGGIVALVVGVLLSLIARENIAGPISRLTLVAEQIRDGDLEAQAEVESKDETGVLAQTFNKMTGQLRHTLTQVRKEKKRADDLLQVVIPIGVDLASERNFNLLLERMLLEAKAFCRSDAGMIFLRTEDNALKFVTIRDDSGSLALGGTTGKAIHYTPLPLYQAPGVPNDQWLPTRAAIQGKSVNAGNPEQVQGMNFSNDAIYTDSKPFSLLAIPLKNSKDQVLGVLQLMDTRDSETGQIIPFDENLQQMLESFSSLAVAALEAYIREQSLQQQIQQLKIEIDEAKRQKQVSEIVETDFFQDLTEKVKKLRSQRKQPLAEKP